MPKARRLDRRAFLRQLSSVIKSRAGFPTSSDAPVNCHQLTLFSGRYAICRLAPDESVPAWALQDSFYTITRTPAELSILCVEQSVPPGVHCQPGWRAFQVQGPLDFGQVGVLSCLADCLAASGIPILAISSFDTDYLLVPEIRLNQAIVALQSAGHTIHGAD